MNEVLMGIVVDVIAFFALSTDDAVDPDAALRCLESISHDLKQLGPKELGALLAFVGKRAAAETRPEMKQFLGELPRAAGLM